MPMTLQEARTTLTSERPVFAKPEHVEAVQRLAQSAARSDAQKRRWTKVQARTREKVRDALDLRVIPCPHCGKVPWMVGKQAVCASKILKEYGIKGLRCPSGWFIKFAKEWFADKSVQELRMVPVEKEASA